MGVELVNALEMQLGIQISENLFDMETTVASLAAGVNELHLQRPETPMSASGEAASPKYETLDDVPAACFDFAQLPEYRELGESLASLEEQDAGGPYFKVHQRIAGDTSVIDGRKVIDFAGCDYLGSSGAPEVVKAVRRAVRQFGTGSPANRALSGEQPILRELEQAIAEFLGTCDAIVLAGANVANQVIGHLLGPGDLILYDESANPCTVEAACVSGADRQAFPHNNANACAGLLADRRTRCNRVLIAIEGVSRRDGDMPDLPAFVDLKDRYKAWLLVDEAHSLGTVGHSGRGVVEHFGVYADHVDMLTGTLGNALGSSGGYVAGSNELIRYLKHTAPGFVHSEGISPSNAAAALAALRRLIKHPELARTCRENAALFRRLAQEKDLDTGNGDNTPIVPILLDDPLSAGRLSQALFERGIHVPATPPPNDPQSTPRLTFFLTAMHTEEQIRRTIKTLDEAVRGLGNL